VPRVRRCGRGGLDRQQDALAAERLEQAGPPQLLRDKVARGELGRKTGKGFFDWTR